MSAKVIFFLTQDQAGLLLAIGGVRDLETVKPATRRSLTLKGLIDVQGQLTPLGEAALAVAARLADLEQPS